MQQHEHRDHCPITGEPLKLPGQTVSNSALGRVVSVTRTLPTLMRELVPDTVKAARPTLDGVRTQMGPRAPVDIGILSEILGVQTTLRGWAERLRERYQPSVSACGRDDWVCVCALFELAPRAAQWVEAPRMVREVTHTVRTAEAMVAGPEDRRARGLCPTCGALLYAPESAPTLACRYCGTTTTTADATTSAWAEIPDLWLAPTHAAAAASLLAGRDVPAATVRTWIARHQLTPVAGQVKVSDVLGRVV